MPPNAPLPDGFQIHDGQRIPPGVTAGEKGVNFSVYSRSATHMSLQLYRDEQTREPLLRIELDPVHNRTFFFWHVFVEGATPGMYYTWQADGPGDTASTGFRFDPEVELLDPRARMISTRLWDRAAATGPKPGTTSMRAGIVGDDGYDWEGDTPINHRLEDSVIYELHVGGFTRHASAGVSQPGTFQGVIEKIPYLQDLGITDVELLPVMAFDTQDVPPGVAGRGLGNFWGYSPCAFYALHPGYAAEPDVRREFRDMVKALHRAGIGVILDVVFNHTAEGGAEGPTISFKGLGNEFYYHLDPEDRSQYRDYSGCGNTLNCNHPAVSRLLLQCLEYWVREMHVDGFRFDLASAMGRGEDGEPMYHAPLLWNIEFSETLANTRLICEAWDAAGLYQVGDFPGFRWAEWNGRYRDTVRRWVRGEVGLRGELAQRLTGSSDLYQANGRLPVNSINFVTCHDGFTLNDLVSYDDKHNEANGEDNRDGSNDNHSWNCGHEGPSDDADILALRRRQVRNHLALLMLSQGVPMLLAGDEMLRSQQGNNNTWCQDNALGWVDWSLLERHGDMHRFVRELIALRKRHPSLRRHRFLTGRPGSGHGGLADIAWYDETGGAPDWQDTQARTLGFMLAGRSPDEDVLLVLLNADETACEFELPEPPRGAWRRCLDSALPSPDDIVAPGEQPELDAPRYRLLDRSVVVLAS
ncbi:MAG: glycogen debranching protein GlgX [Gammaproteobacteria bacterium]|nr:glycogen debranching protein GlgX [Gammaproteobacteria bacterium]